MLLGLGVFQALLPKPVRESFDLVLFHVSMIDRIALLDASLSSSSSSNARGNSSLVQEPHP